MEIAAYTDEEASILKKVENVILEALCCCLCLAMRGAVIHNIIVHIYLIYFHLLLHAQVLFTY